MVLRKPYAFVIKHFKLIHIIMFVLIGILVSNTFTTLNFLNEFLSSNLAYIDKVDFNNNFSIGMILIPIIIIAVFGGLLALMYMKQKPIKFYIFSIIGTVFIFGLNIYVRSVMYSMIESLQSVQTLKISADMLLFSVFFELFMLLACFIRGIGFNISRFDFNTDLNEMIEEDDREEVELQFDLDLNDVKRNSNKRKRQIKYFIKENQFVLKIVAGVLGCILLIFGVKTYINSRKHIVKNTVTLNGFRFEVIDSYMLNNDINNNKLDDNIYLIAVRTKITNLDKKDKKVFKTGTLLLDLDGDTYSVSESYSSEVQDIGINYMNSDIESEQTGEYVVVFAIPKNHIKSNKMIGVRDIYGEKTTYIKIKPQNLSNKADKVIESKLNEEISFDDSTVKNTKFTITSVDVQNKFKIEYKFKYNKQDTMDSVEYVTPKVLDKKIDKGLMKLEIKYGNKDSKDIMFLLEKFGHIEFTKGDTKYDQKIGFNRVLPTSVKMDNVYYIEVNKEMIDAEKIDLVFNIRNIEYKYNLK